MPSERNGDITTFSVTTDKVSDICLSWKIACLIMWRPSWIPRYKESLFSFQSATGSEIQRNMTAPWRKFWHCQNVRRHRKHRYRHLHCGPRCNRTGDMGKTMVIVAPYWKSIWRPPGFANLWGLFFLMIYMYYRTVMQSFMLSSKTERQR